MIIPRPILTSRSPSIHQRRALSASRPPRYFRLTGVSGTDMKEVSIVDIAFHHVKILPSCQGKASSSIRATLANCRSRQQLDRGAASPSRGLSVRWNRCNHSPPAHLGHNRRRTEHSDALRTEHGPAGVFVFGCRRYLEFYRPCRGQAERKGCHESPERFVTEHCPKWAAREVS